MSRPKKDIVKISEQGVLTEEGILAYLRNELDVREKLEVEKLLEQDPFAQDALEGLQQAKNEPGLSSSISSLKRRVRERTGLKEKRVLKIHWVNYAWAAVVVGLLIGVGVVMINYFGKGNKEPIASNKTKEESKPAVIEQRPPPASEKTEAVADSTAGAAASIHDVEETSAKPATGVVTNSTGALAGAAGRTGQSGPTANQLMGAPVAALRQGITTKSFANGQPLNYQAVITDKAGQPLKNGTPVSLRFTVHEASPTGKSLYSETDITSTNQSGLVDVMVGNSKNFGNVDFSTGPKYLQVEADPNNSGKFNTLANSQMISVPSAGYAANSAPSAKPATTGGASGVTANGAGAMDMAFSPKQSAQPVTISANKAKENNFSAAAPEAMVSEKDKKAENENGSLDVAMKNFNSGDYKKSAKEFEKILKHEPENIDAIYFGAISDYLNGNSARAEGGFDKVLKKGSKFVEGSKWYKANILLTKGDIEHAKSLLQEIAAGNGSYKERAVKKMSEMGF
jgi:hypothetical protein